MAQVPEYFLSQRYPYADSLYEDIADNRTLTKISRERTWDNGWVYSGNFLKSRTTGGFDSNGTPDVTSSAISNLGGYDKIISFKGFQKPTTNRGDTLLWVGNTTASGNPVASAGLLWKADNNTRIVQPIEGSIELVPTDMNEGLTACGYILIPYVNSFNQDRERPVPVLISSSGTVSVIEPSRISEYGFDVEPELRLNNQFEAVAINNQGAVVCTGKGALPQGGESDRFYVDHWSFVSQNGSIVVEQLPRGATDINDHGEVVGYNNGGTWVYRPSARNGQPAGVTIIDTVRYNNGWTDDYEFVSIQPLISNRGDVTWLGTYFTIVGAPTYPARLWKDGFVYNLTELFTADEEFEIQSVTDMNTKGDLLLTTTYQVESNGSISKRFANRILSTRAFQEELVVNVTDDLSDADPGDQVIDIDLEKTGLQVSLRAAVEEVNAGNITDIEFDIPGEEVPVIILTQELPAITFPVNIDGTTQSAGKVEIRGGAFAGAGLHLQGGDSEVRGMVMHGFNGVDSAAVRISGAGGNVVAGNWLGTNAEGTEAMHTQFGVLIEGSPDNLVGGEDDGEGNILYGETAGVMIRGGGADDNRVLGNRVGVGTDDSILTPLVGPGITLNGGEGTIVGTPESGNLVAGGVGITVSPDGSPLRNIQISGNQIGLDGSGSVATNGFAGIFLIAAEGDILTDVVISENKISGNMLNLFAADFGGIDDLTIRDNEIGFAFTGSGVAPNGLEEGVQQYGLRLDGPLSGRVTGNVVAGHSYNVLLSGINQLSIFGGEDTDGDGVPDSNFSVDINNPEETEYPDVGDAVAEGIEIKNNFVGVDRSYRVPEGSPEQLMGIVNFGGARGTEIDGNTIGGHSAFGLWIESGLQISAELNHIGVSSGGLPIPNGGGVQIGEAVVSMKDNTVAQNTNVGIFVQDLDNAVSILGGSIYKNGSGAGPVGIIYEVASVDPIEDLFVFRSNLDDRTGMVEVTIAVPAVGGTVDKESGEDEPETTLEIWSNRFDSETQGRTLVLSEGIDPEVDFAHKLTVGPDSAFVSADNFTATITRGRLTSAFSDAVSPKILDWPELDLSPNGGEGGVTISEDEIAFEWPVAIDEDLFILEQASSFAGPWVPVSATTSVSDGKAQVTVPMEGSELYFRLKMNPAALTGKQGNFSELPLYLELMPLLPQ